MCHSGLSRQGFRIAKTLVQGILIKKTAQEEAWITLLYVLCVVAAILGLFYGYIALWPSYVAGAGNTRPNHRCLSTTTGVLVVGQVS